MQLVLVLQADYVLEGGLLVFQEDQLCIFAGALGRSGHVSQHLSGDIDVVLDLISHAGNGGLSARFSVLSPFFLHEVELVDQVDHIRQHFSRRTLGDVESTQGDARLYCIWRPHNDFDAFVNDVYQERHLMCVFLGIFDQSLYGCP